MAAIKMLDYDNRRRKPCRQSPQYFAQCSQSASGRRQSYDVVGSARQSLKPVSCRGIFFAHYTSGHDPFLTVSAIFRVSKTTIVPADRTGQAHPCADVLALRRRAREKQQCVLQD